MQCGTILPRWRIIGAYGDEDMPACVCTGQHEMHAFKTPEGKRYVWSEDWECDCEECQSSDSDDHCIIWDEITEEEFKKLTGQT